VQVLQKGRNGFTIDVGSGKAVMSFVSGNLGHIGNYVLCLGRNQSDRVRITVYHKKYATAFRSKISSHSVSVAWVFERAELRSISF
jgi:hypothetical protein